MRFELKENKRPDEAVAYFSLEKDGDDIILWEDLPTHPYVVLRISRDGLYRCGGLGMDTGFPVDSKGRIKDTS